jgi:hypothetical protein
VLIDGAAARREDAAALFAQAVSRLPSDRDLVAPVIENDGNF